MGFSRFQLFPEALDLDPPVMISMYPVTTALITLMLLINKLLSVTGKAFLQLVVKNNERGCMYVCIWGNFQFAEIC